ncbi:hypothetical protein ALC57_18358 [Trachymyrmex cornetzi]|uniref:Uncharacterized protein n=1 Tax=Trachymyrmex cornetzi TaxID=471704 RepID=A0A151IS54_9HYME|nr:hypothetical protein ALC57_18358 [Trachymyrmex cornetzi]
MGGNVGNRSRSYRGWRRSRAYLEARELLDVAFQEYLRDISRVEDAPQPSYSPPSALPTPPPQQQNIENIEAIPPSPPPRSPSPAFSDALTERIFSDTPPPTPDSFLQSAPSSPRPPSPTDSTSSVEILEEFPAASPRLTRRYIQPGDSFDAVISHFPRITNPLPPGIYTIGPNYFDPEELRAAITGHPPDVYTHSSVYSFFPLPIFSPH